MFSQNIKYKEGFLVFNCNNLALSSVFQSFYKNLRTCFMMKYLKVYLPLEVLNIK